MPYTSKGKCVYKKDTGKKAGCTKGSVNKYLAALHANVPDVKSECCLECNSNPCKCKSSKLIDIVNEINDELYRLNQNEGVWINSKVHDDQLWMQ